MKFLFLLLSGIYHRHLPMKMPYMSVYVGVLLLVNVALFGCKGTTIGPTEPSPLEPLPIPEPTETVTPSPEFTPTPDIRWDNYAETPDDPNILTLEPRDEPYTIIMDYTGDIDWYRIRVPSDTTTLTILLADIPEKNDYDIIAYTLDLKELENGRSAQSGNTAEQLVVSPTDPLIYIQIYSYSGRGEATLTITAEANGGTDFDHLTYEEVLSTYYAMYPRGTTSELLARSVETVAVQEITCQTLNGTLSGELTIGNYAHVARELLEPVDYIDGWALVVFNGPVRVLENLNVTIRVTIDASQLDMEVIAPSSMEIEGYDYLVSGSESDWYFWAQPYGDLWSNSSADLQVSSGVVGDLGDLFSNDIFTQQVEVEWEWAHSDGTICSGNTTGRQIVDFESEPPFLYRRPLNQWQKF